MAKAKKDELSQEEIDALLGGETKSAKTKTVKAKATNAKTTKKTKAVSEKKAASKKISAERKTKASDLIKVELTAVLGKTIVSVQDLDKYGEGSIVELDKLAGEPVDLLANGQKVASGEVVVIDENFAVRITEIL